MEKEHSVVEEVLSFCGCVVANEYVRSRAGNNKVTGYASILAKDEKGALRVLSMPAYYRVIIGAQTPERCTNARIEIMSRLGAYQNSVKVQSMGERFMMYRKVGHAIKFSCNDYKVYLALERVSRTVINELGLGIIWKCNTFLTEEEQFLGSLNIFGANHITYSYKQRVDREEFISIRPSTEQEVQKFNYAPKIAATDIEVLSLNVSDPNCRWYMTSYYCNGIAKVWYTKDFHPEKITYPNEPGSPYRIQAILCENSLDMAKKWIETIYKDAPDVVTGYNLYNLDLPAICKEFMRNLQPLPKHPATGFDPYVIRTKKLDKKSSDSDSGMCPILPGVSFIDIYPYLDKLIPNEEKESMKLGEVSKKYLKDDKKDLSYVEQRRIYEEGTLSEKLKLIEYSAHDSYLPVMLYKHFSVWERMRAVYSRTGVHMQKQLTSGMVAQVSGRLCMKAAERRMLLDEPMSESMQPGGGFVHDVIPGRWQDVQPVDFSSLYPNIAIAYNTCPSTMYMNPPDECKAGESCRGCEYCDQFYKLRCESGKAVYFLKEPMGLTPASLDEGLRMREESKQKMKKAMELYGKDSKEYKLADAAQLADKELNNSTIGAFAERASGTNPIVSTELNDVVTTTGRRIAKEIRKLAKSMGITVIYGDTDSLFLTPGSKVDEFLDVVHSRCPKNIRLVKEAPVKELIIKKKKHYVFVYPDNSLKIAGYKSVKSSAPPIARDIFKKIITILVTEGHEAARKAYRKVLRKAEKVEDISKFCKVLTNKGKVYKPGSSKGMLLERMYARGVVMSSGETKLVTYVYTEEQYYTKYQSVSKVPLPRGTTKMSDIIFTLEEVSRDIRCINRALVIEKECGTNIRELIEVCDDSDKL